jgi:serine/threonine protein kinase
MGSRRWLLALGTPEPGRPTLKPAPQVGFRTTPGDRGETSVPEPCGVSGAYAIALPARRRKARDTRLDRTVAVKVLPDGAAALPEVRQRFEREARAVSALNHPHICSLFDIGSQDGVDYLVMEFLEGETLAERVKKGPLPVEQALRFGIDIAGALEAAHRQGVIHRDLKPANIMITASGPKVLDFGLARMEQQRAACRFRRLRPRHPYHSTHGPRRHRRHLAVYGAGATGG